MGKVDQNVNRARCSRFSKSFPDVDSVATHLAPHFNAESVKLLRTGYELPLTPAVALDLPILWEIPVRYPTQQELGCVFDSEKRGIYLIEASEYVEEKAGWTWKPNVGSGM